MLVRDLDLWLDERGLVLDIDSPYYTAIIYPPAGRALVSAGASSITEAVRRAIAEADLRQRQEDERWALERNPAFYVTTEALDREMEARGEFLNVAAGLPPERYGVFTVKRDGTETSRMIFGDSLERVASEVALSSPPAAPPFEELLRGYEAERGRPFGAAGAHPESLVEQAVSIAQARGAYRAAVETGVPSSTIRGRMKRRGAGTARPTASGRVFHPDEKRAAVQMLQERGMAYTMREFGVSDNSLRRWRDELAQMQSRSQGLTYAEVAPLVDRLGSAAAAAAELGADPDVVAAIYYRGVRAVERVQAATAGSREQLPPVSAEVLEVAREYGVPEAVRQFGVDAEAVRAALVAVEA